jgi:membrane protein
MILQQVATVYLTTITKSPSFAVFGPIIGLLVFANLVSRFLLFVTAWTATAEENMRIKVAPPPPAVLRPRVSVERGPGVGAVAGAFGAGAILGWLGRRRTRADAPGQTHQGRRTAEQTHRGRVTRR